jgi:uncharacterized protein YPO0396
MKNMKTTSKTAGFFIALLASGIIFSCAETDKETPQEMDIRTDEILIEKDTSIMVAPEDKSESTIKREMEEFKTKVENRLDKNSAEIEKLKTEMVHKKKEVKADYQAMVDRLDRKNNDLKTRLSNYREEGQESWNAFKTEFNHDMNDLEASIKNLFKDNKK